MSAKSYSWLVKRYIETCGINITKGKIPMAEYNATTGSFSDLVEKNAHNPLQNIALRLGVIF